MKPKMDFALPESWLGTCLVCSKRGRKKEMHGIAEKQFGTMVMLGYLCDNCFRKWKKKWKGAES